MHRFLFLSSVTAFIVVDHSLSYITLTVGLLLDLWIWFLNIEEEEFIFHIIRHKKANA